MDSIRSSNVLKLDIESFYKFIAENKHGRQSKQVKKESNQTTTHIFFRGKLATQNPSIFYCIFTMESWNNYNALFSQESPTLSQLSHTDPDKIDQQFANSQPLISLPYLRCRNLQGKFLRSNTKGHCSQTDQKSVHQYITWLKPSKRETVHDLSQRGHIRQFINIKKKNYICFSHKRLSNKWPSMLFK